MSHQYKLRLKWKLKAKEDRFKSRNKFYKENGWKTAVINKKTIHQGYYVLSFRKYSSGFFVKEHRFLMMKFLNKILLPNKCIHHKNGNKLNNDISNLQIISRKSHAKKYNKHINPFTRLKNDCEQMIKILDKAMFLLW